MAELVGCKACGAAAAVRLPEAGEETVTCAACAADQPVSAYLTAIGQLQRATSTNRIPRVVVGIQPEMRARVDERKAKRRIAVVLGLVCAIGAIVAIVVLAAC